MIILLNISHLCTPQNILILLLSLTPFFVKLNLLTVSLSSELYSPICQQEVIVAMQSGKAPGPDGFPIKFYKKFSALMSPLIVAIYNDAFDKGSLSDSYTGINYSLTERQQGSHSLLIV